MPVIKIRKIIYPTDFSEYARCAEPYVKELAKKFKSSVCVLHVIQNPIVPGSYDIVVDTSSFLEDARRQADKLLAKPARSLRAAGIKVQTAVEIGTPFIEIVRAAKDRGADLIVMPTHGHGLVKHLLLGSNAERVVRNAPCPVLTVRHPEHEFVSP